MRKKAEILKIVEQLSIQGFGHIVFWEAKIKKQLGVWGMRVKLIGESFIFTFRKSLKYAFIFIELINSTAKML